MSFAVTTLWSKACGTRSFGMTSDKNYLYIYLLDEFYFNILFIYKYCIILFFKTTFNVVQYAQIIIID